MRRGYPTVCRRVIALRVAGARRAKKVVWSRPVVVVDAAARRQYLDNSLPAAAIGM
jgi:hypothetical protein